MSLSKPTNTTTDQTHELTQDEIRTKEALKTVFDRFLSKHPIVVIKPNSKSSWTMDLPEQYKIRLEITNEDLVKFTVLSGSMLQIPCGPERPINPNDHAFRAVAHLTNKVREGVWDCQLFVKGLPFATGSYFHTGRETHPRVFQFVLTPLEVQEVLDDIYVFIVYVNKHTPELC